MFAIRRNASISGLRRFNVGNFFCELSFVTMHKCPGLVRNICAERSALLRRVVKIRHFRSLSSVIHQPTSVSAWRSCR